MNILEIKNNNSGAILLVTLLIMFGIVATTASMAFIIINEIQQSRDVDYSIIAYYAAETAVEQGLFQLRKGALTVHDLNSDGDVLLDNGASWTRIASNQVAQVSAPLDENKSLTVDFYNFDDLSEDTDIGSIKISGTDDTAWLETTLLEWPVGPNLTWNIQLPQNIYKTMTPLPLAGNDIELGTPRSGNAYQLRLKAFYDDIENNLTITAWSSAGEPRNILGQVTMTGIGDYKHSTQAVQVSLPRRPVLSGVYDYIVFSDLSLTK